MGARAGLESSYLVPGLPGERESQKSRRDALRDCSHDEPALQKPVLARCAIQFGASLRFANASSESQRAQHPIPLRKLATCEPKEDGRLYATRQSLSQCSLLESGRERRGHEDRFAGDCGASG